MKVSEREIDRFQAIDDEEQSYTVVQWQKITLSRTINGKLISIGGNSRFALLSGESGENVNHIKDDTFQIVETNKIIRKVS